MTGLDVALQEYLLTRRAAGFGLQRSEKLLGQFLEYCHQVGSTTITTEVAVAWAAMPAHASPGWRGQRLRAVRRFAAWRQLTDPATEVPPADALGPTGNQRAVPYLYQQEEIVALMAATTMLRWPLGQATYETLIGLLAVTGMRVGEAIGLNRTDLDAATRWLSIRTGKDGKTRQVRLSESTIEALADYRRRRDQLCPQPATPALLVSSAGTRLLSCNVGSTFRNLVANVGLQPRSSRCRPRLHDLRHSFAVATLTDWYRDGVDVAARLPALSTYLGHVDPKSTYWYLDAAPELMALAADRLQRHQQAQP